MYVPELVMGNLLAGSNFDDSQKRLGGGRHGYGAKLTNIFSTAFTVETAEYVYRHKCLDMKYHRYEYIDIQHWTRGGGGQT